jgi:hypothetical protein
MQAGARRPPPSRRSTVTYRSSPLNGMRQKDRRRHQVASGTDSATSRAAAVDRRIAPAQLLLAAEDQWLTDRLRGETQSTDQLLHDDYFGTAPNGVAHCKQDFVESVGRGKHAGTSWRSSDRTMRVYGSTAISTGNVVVTTASGVHAYRYLRVYVKEHDRWLLIASQALAIKS